MATCSNSKFLIAQTAWLRILNVTAFFSEEYYQQHSFNKHVFKEL